MEACEIAFDHHEHNTRNPLHHEMGPVSRKRQSKDMEEKETESEDKKEGPADQVNEKERDGELT